LQLVIYIYQVVIDVNSGDKDTRNHTEQEQGRASWRAAMVISDAS
jgi:hypothetical protein